MCNARLAERGWGVWATGNWKAAQGQRQRLGRRVGWLEARCECEVLRYAALAIGAIGGALSARPAVHSLEQAFASCSAAIGTKHGEVTSSSRRTAVEMACASCLAASLARLTGLAGSEGESEITNCPSFARCTKAKTNHNYYCGG